MIFVAQQLAEANFENMIWISTEMGLNPGGKNHENCTDRQSQQW